MEESGIDLLTKEQVREHLRNAGFHNVPDAVLEEFILDIVKLENTPSNNRGKSQHYRKTHHRQNSFSTSDETDFEQNQKENRYFNQYEENEDLVSSSFDNRKSRFQFSGKYSGYSADEVSEYSQYEPVYTRNTVSTKKQGPSYEYKHKQGQSRNQNAWNTCSTTTAFKKTDPVARYHKLQAIWKKDKFLQHLEKPRRNLGVPFPLQSQYQKSAANCY